MQFLSIYDLLFVPIFLVIILVVARIYRNRMIVNHPEYKFYLPGLCAKLFGGFGLIMVYTLYYPGGDTIQYYLDGVAINKLMFYDPASYFKLMTRAHDPSVYYYFNQDTGFPSYHRDPHAFFVSKLSSLIALFSFKSIVVANILVAAISFVGVWKLYRVFMFEFPEIGKQLAIAVFFIPSVFFWGSGLLKDTFTFSSMGFFTYSFYMIFIKRRKIISNLITLMVAGFVIISIKPYILIGLLPGVLIWIIHNLLLKIKGGIARTAVLPILLGVTYIFGFFILNMLEGSLDQYAIDNILNKAVVTQQDLKKDYYRGNSFDIGDFDADINSMLLKAPAAISATLFRPFILEANNLVMLLSSLENLVILYFSIKVLLKSRIIGFFRIVFSNHLLTFAFIFTIFFAFSVGISTSNFGSLVRYKIPVIPFYIAILYKVQYELKLKSENRKLLKTKVFEEPQELILSNV